MECFGADTFALEWILVDSKHIPGQVHSGLQKLHQNLPEATCSTVPGTVRVQK